MSHELRTPLNAIIGFADVIAAQGLGQDNVRYREYASDISVAGGHLLAIIDDLLDISRIDIGAVEIKEEPVDVREVLKDCYRMVAMNAREKGLTLQLTLPEEDIVCLTDRRALKQVVVNLISNAVKFTEIGGEVRLAARVTTPTQARISVRDSGIGMTPEQLRSVFEPFWRAETVLTRKYEGVGLGLAIVKRLLTFMTNFRLSIDSTLGQGTEAVLEFPLEKRSH